MARKAVLEIQCDRCTRIEHREDAPPSFREGAQAALHVALGDGQVYSFQDLCSPCERTIRNHLSAIVKKIDGPSPDRQLKSLEEIEVLPRVIDNPDVNWEGKKKG